MIECLSNVLRRLCAASCCAEAAGARRGPAGRHWEGHPQRPPAASGTAPEGQEPPPPPPPAPPCKPKQAPPPPPRKAHRRRQCWQR